MTTRRTWTSENGFPRTQKPRYPRPRDENRKRST